MIAFQQSESNAERRRWVIVLVDSTDGVTGKTGQSGTVFISKNGGAAVASTNSLVEIDSGDMPGQYYIELTAAELDTLGHISISYKAAQTLAFHDRAIVSYNNPYQSVGGFSGGGSKGLTKAQLDELLKQLKKLIKEELSKIKFPEPPDLPEIPDYSESLSVLLNKETDINPILEAISAIPKPADYTANFATLASGLMELTKLKAMDIDGFNKATKEFMSKMEIATDDINGSLEEVEKIKDGLEELNKMMGEFNETLAEQKDMDKRFDAMNSASNNKKIEALAEKMTDLAVAITNLRYDLKEKELL